MIRPGLLVLPILIAVLLAAALVSGPVMAQPTGRRVSVPFGDAARGVLLKALVDRARTQASSTVRNQRPLLPGTSSQEKRTGAHADFSPWGELMEFKGFGRKICDGSQTS